jgi:hypothetical protein
LSPRSYSSLYDAVAEFLETPEPAGGEGEHAPQRQELSRLIAEPLRPNESQPFWLGATDVTPVPRLFAKSLADRGVVYALNPTLSYKPVAVGHSDSAWVALPEPAVGSAPEPSAHGERHDGNHHWRRGESRLWGHPSCSHSAPTPDPIQGTPSPQKSTFSSAAKSNA